MRAAPLPPVPWRRWRRRLRRAGGGWWALAAAGAVLGAVQLASAGATADADRRAWGTTVAVAVARTDLAPGHVVGPDDARVEDRPAAVVPTGALDSVPVGDVVVAAVLAGEPLVTSRVGSGGLSAVAARVPAGSRAVAVPVDSGGAPPVRPGDLVDLLATADGAGADGGATTLVAAGAVVVDVADDAVTVAVSEPDAAAVAAAAARGRVTLALVGAGG